MILSRRQTLLGSSAIASTVIALPPQADAQVLPLLITLFPALHILLGLLGGGLTLSAALSTISIAQWVQIGVAILKAAPYEIQLVRSLHEAFDQLISAVLAHGNAAAVPATVQAWLKANAEKAMELQGGISRER